MTTAITSPEDIVNLALGRIGYKGSRVGSIYEGSRASKKALDIYAQTRDELIRDGEWEFAERIVAGTLLKQAPPSYVATPWSAATNPDLPWLFSYAYPSDCLDVRSVRQTPMFVPNFDPQHNVFSLGNDNALNPPQRVILCNVPNALVTYAGRITDPTTFDPGFVEEFAAALGRRLAPGLVGLDAAKLEISDEQAEGQLARQEKG
jgi:hypothetical protein